jgi:hypothetical protein
VFSKYLDLRENKYHEAEVAIVVRNIHDGVIKAEV